VKILKATKIDTELGEMVAISDDQTLYFLDFSDRKDLKSKIEGLERKLEAGIVPGESALLELTSSEIKAYFEGRLTKFTIPVFLYGTVFEKLVWSKLQLVPFGQTQTYSTQAKAMQKETAYRAVANANGKNPISIIVPCHRIIRSDGDIGGYGGGGWRKRWLIEHEKKANS
jgi:AraC family transcriptional regulator of adaptative response/methylated-DNA-[protein]-cysteine methyltransferase